ncbi:hypothetical protein D3C73_809520 [compost metagenome]
MKQMALIVVTMPKACSGISLLSSAPAEITSVEIKSELPGTWLLFSLAKEADALPLLLRLYRIRLVENIPLLQAEAAEVNTTKLIMPAAIGMPTKVKVLTNGLSAGLSCVHGLMHSRTNRAPT